MDPKGILTIRKTSTLTENCEVQTNSKDGVTIPKAITEELKKVYRKRKMDSKDGIAGDTIQTTKEDCKKGKMDPKDLVDNISVDENKVLINVNHPDDEPDIYLNSQIAAIVKPHQIDGIRFIFHKIIESLAKFKTSQSGSGCVLAHATGLGKTLQTIGFCDLFFRITDCRKIICITPVSTIKNWKLEFDKFLPPNGKSPRTFTVYTSTEKRKNRINIVQSWSSKGGVLLIGYEMFRSEVNKKDSKDNIGSYLLAADLVICDEGHRIKNYMSDTLVALTKLQSNRKIILTGYPLQNNLLEYWCMINFIKPNYLGTIPQFVELFKSPIEKGQYIDSTTDEKKLMRYRSFVLHSLLSNFVQREHILPHLLPPKHDFVLFIKMTTFQKNLYTSFSNIDAANNVLTSFAMSIKILNHPDILYNFLMSQTNAAPTVDNTIDNKIEIPTTENLQEYTNSKTWALELMKEYKKDIIENSTKVEIVFSILKECKDIGDRVVLFSQSLASLNLIECFLQSEFKWKKNWNYFRLDGSTVMTERQKLISEFNNNTKSHYF